jgi:hypothetical protein
MVVVNGRLENNAVVGRISLLSEMMNVTYGYGLQILK